MLQVYTLRNGIKVATYSLPKLRSVFLDLAVKGGGLQEDEKTSGTAHFMEHLLLEGTPSYPSSEELSDFIESLAGATNAITSAQQIRAFVHGPLNHLEDILKVGSEMFFQSLFKSDAVEKERSAIIEELRQRQDNLHYKLSKFYSDTRFKKGHPMRLNAETQSAVIPTLTRDDLFRTWQQLFVPKNTHLVLVGGFRDSEAKALVGKYFANFSTTPSFSGFPNLSNKDYSGRTVAIRTDMELRSCYVDLSWPSIGDQNSLKDKVIQVIIRYILGGLSASRLYRLLRQQRGLVYTVSAGTSVFISFGSFYISTEVAVEKLDEVVKLITKEFEQFIQFGPTNAEIAFAKNYYINRTLMSWDNPGNIAEWIRSDLMWEAKVERPEEFVELIKPLKKKDINQFIKKYWELDKLNLVIQGPVKNSRANLSKYEKMLVKLK